MKKNTFFSENVCLSSEMVYIHQVEKEGQIMKYCWKKSVFLLGLVFLCGCTGLPEGEVPESLVGSQNGNETGSMTINDAEAAMSGAIVRTLVRIGHSADRTPMAFTENSTPQSSSFVKLLHGTDMVQIGKAASASYLIESRQEKGTWTLRILKKDGTILLKKTVKYR